MVTRKRVQYSTSLKNQKCNSRYPIYAFNDPQNSVLELVFSSVCCGGQLWDCATINKKIFTIKCLFIKFDTLPQAGFLSRVLAIKFKTIFSLVSNNFAKDQFNYDLIVILISVNLYEGHFNLQVICLIKTKFKVSNVTINDDMYDVTCINVEKILTYINMFNLKYFFYHKIKSALIQ